MVEVTISLVSHKQLHDLERLLPSLISAAASLPSEVLLVDNRSQDGTEEYVSGGAPRVDILHNPAVAGYGENHNLNLSRARGRYFVVMNCDMVVSEEIFVGLRNFMDQNDDVGIVSPKILNEDGTIQGLNKRYPTLLDLVLRRFVPKTLQFFVQRRLDYYEMRDVSYEHMIDIPFLSGAFMFCRTELLRRLGGFDPRYFLYFEDVDLCRRVQQTHRTVYLPDYSVIHFWQRSAHRDWKYTYYFIKSAFRYFRRWGFRLF